MSKGSPANIVCEEGITCVLTIGLSSSALAGLAINVRANRLSRTNFVFSKKNLDMLLLHSLFLMCENHSRTNIVYIRIFLMIGSVIFLLSRGRYERSATLDTIY